MKKQPTQVRKILDNLLNLSKIENITPLEVHSSMLSLLKSNPVLVDCFFQLIPTEHPPERYFSALLFILINNYFIKNPNQKNC